MDRVLFFFFSLGRGTKANKSWWPREEIKKICISLHFPLTLLSPTIIFHLTNPTRSLSARDIYSPQRSVSWNRIEWEKMRGGYRRANSICPVLLLLLTTILKYEYYDSNNAITTILITASIWAPALCPLHQSCLIQVRKWWFTSYCASQCHCRVEVKITLWE